MASNKTIAELEAEGKRKCRYCKRWFAASEVGVHEREHPVIVYQDPYTGEDIVTRGYK